MESVYRHDATIYDLYTTSTLNNVLCCYTTVFAVVVLLVKQPRTEVWALYTTQYHRQLHAQVVCKQSTARRLPALDTIRGSNLSRSGSIQPKLQMNNITLHRPLAHQLPANAPDAPWFMQQCLKTLNFFKILPLHVSVYMAIINCYLSV
jgi:hypothetical protein